MLGQLLRQIADDERMKSSPSTTPTSDAASGSDVSDDLDTPLSADAAKPPNPFDPPSCDVAAATPRPENPFMKPSRPPPPTQKPGNPFAPAHPSATPTPPKNPFGVEKPRGTPTHAAPLAALVSTSSWMATSLDHVLTYLEFVLSRNERLLLHVASSPASGMFLKVLFAPVDVTSHGMPDSMCTLRSSTTPIGKRCYRFLATLAGFFLQLSKEKCYGFVDDLLEHMPKLTMTDCKTYLGKDLLIIKPLEPRPVGFSLCSR